MGILNSCALIGFRAKENKTPRVIQAGICGDSDSALMEQEEETPSLWLRYAIVLGRATNLAVFERAGDPGILAYLHVVLAFFP